MITLYSTHCPKCSVLEAKLKQKGVQYKINDDIEAMKQKGLKAAPALELDNGKILDFSQSLAWVREA